MNTIIFRAVIKINILICYKSSLSRALFGEKWLYLHSEKYQFNDLYFIEITKKKRPHNNFSIYSFVELDNGIIASGGEDHLIKLWEYNKSN